MRKQSYSISWPSEGRYRRLRHILPEFRIMAEEQRRAALFQRLQPVERGQHRLAVIDEARQPSFTQRAAEVAGVAGEDDGALVGAHLERLMTGRVAVGR